MNKSIEEAESRTLELSRKVAKICDEKRAEEIRLLDVRGLCGYADFFVIATVPVSTMMKGISKDIEKEMKNNNLSQLSRAGFEDTQWILLDYGDLIIHFFTPETRAFYELDELWGDAPEVEF